MGRQILQIFRKCANIFPRRRMYLGIEKINYTQTRKRILANFPPSSSFSQARTISFFSPLYDSSTRVQYCCVKSSSCVTSRRHPRTEIEDTREKSNEEREKGDPSGGQTFFVFDLENIFPPFLPAHALLCFHLSSFKSFETPSIHQPFVSRSTALSKALEKMIDKELNGGGLFYWMVGGIVGYAFAY